MSEPQNSALPALIVDQPLKPLAAYVLPLAEIEGEALPEPYRTLLKHGQHMTEVLEELNGGPLQLTVIERRLQLSMYSRVITLSGQARVLEFAVISIDLDKCPPPVALDILKEQAPLGRILINHNVERNLQVLQFFQVTLIPGNAAFAVDHPAYTYGRLIAIKINGSTAIEALELLAPELI